MKTNNKLSYLFKDLTVLDLSSVLAGPQVGSFFAELGAKVIKIENKKSGGDPTRQWKLEGEKGSDVISSYYASANYCKESLFLDLSLKDDYQEVKRLALTSDIILSNYQPRVAKKLKVDYQNLSIDNPKVIYAQLHAYAPDDPRPGYDLVMQAETGFMSMNGQPDGAPSKMPVAIIDLMAAHQLKEAILIAIIKRDRDAAGSLVEVSLYQSAIASLANQASNYLMAEHIPVKMGSLHPNIAPYGDVYFSKDEIPFILAVGSDAQFRKLGETLNCDKLLSTTFEYNSDRLIHRDKMNKLIESVFLKKTYLEIEQLLILQGIPFCRVQSLDSVFTQKLAKNMVLEHVIEGNAVKSVSQIAFTIT